LKQKENIFQMLYMIVERVREDDYVVDESSIVIAVSSQRPVYEALCVRRGVRESYEDYLRAFYLLLIDKSESIAVIRVYGQLKEEIGYVDNCDILFLID